MTSEENGGLLAVSGGGGSGGGGGDAWPCSEHDLPDSTQTTQWKRKDETLYKALLILRSVPSESAVVATGRRLQFSESADSNFADWAVASSSTTHSSAAAAFGDLSLGFNAATNSAVDGGSAAAAAAGHVGLWSSRQMQINHGFNPDMGMFVVAPAASFLHHHNFQHFHNQNSISFDGSNPTATALGDGVGVIATNVNYTKKAEQHGHGSTSNNNNSNNSQNLFQIQGGGATSSSTVVTTCQDCGNQAKKDCVHRRCRTCCKSRGLDCSTHVKSTWVSAARRRERHASSTPAAVTAASCSQSVSSGNKKPRLVLGNNSQTSHTSTSNNTATTPRSFDTGDSGGGSMPKQVTAPAEFRCVRVCPVDGGEDDEYAYQAVVRIGGHVFKGFLYDQGPDTDRNDHAGNTGNAVTHPILFPDISDLHLGARGGNNNVILGAAPIIAPSSHDIYGASASASGSGGGGIIGMGSSNFGIGNLNPF